MNTSLPDDLRELQQKCDATYTEAPKLERTHYYDSLRKAHIKYCSSADQNIVDALLACWFPHVRFIVNDSMLPSMHNVEIGLLISSLCKNSVLRTRCVAHKERAELLAGLCMTRASMADLGYIHPPMNNIGTLLALWSGKPKFRDACKSLENTVSLLYGQACWSLYHDAVTNMSALPAYLYGLHLPIAGIDNSPFEYSQECDLPFDLS